MSRLYHSLMPALMLSLVAAGCGSSSVTEIAGPTAATRCQSSLAAPSIPAAGGPVQATVAAARECDWTVSSQSPWLQVSPPSGQGEGTLTLTAAANPAATARSGVVSLNGQTVTVTQAASPCQLSVSATRVEVTGAGARKAVEVSAPSGCGWTAQSPVPWIVVVTGSGTGSGVAYFDVAPNPSGPRTAIVQVAGAGVEFYQEEAPTESAPTDPTPSPTPAPAPSPTPDPTPAPGDGCGNKGNGKCKDVTIALFALPSSGDRL